jgi:transposase
MALGRREGSDREMWIATNRLARSPGHPFYERLNRVLSEAGFDRFAEEQCKPFYAAGQGRPSIPPGVYFRMLMVGYFEGIDSQRGIAWRCTDSLALREFLGVGLGDRVPDHSSLTVIRQRLALELHEEVFVFVLRVLAQKGVLRGKTIGVDATTLEANAAMKSIVRRDTGESWREYIRGLAAEEGVDDPSDDDARRMDRGRKKKRVSNEDWASPSDPEGRITKLKDGRTRLGYKAEHVVDLETEAVLAATIYPGDASDGETFVDSISRSQENVARAESEGFAEEVVADKGYHKASELAEVQAFGIRTYIPERNERPKRRWRDKPREWREAFFSNRRRLRRAKGRRLQRLRSERLERTFAHVCGTGGARRTWLRGVDNVQKRYLVTVAARNLGLLMRVLFGVGSPRSLQGISILVFSVTYIVSYAPRRLHSVLTRVASDSRRAMEGLAMNRILIHLVPESTPSSTGC